ncbi:MAG: hypothetical protein WC943_03885 [Elusimicrobiota bacterium]
MFELILIASLSPMAPMTAQVQPCVWPNLCQTQPQTQTAQVQPCVWPNLCQSEPLPVVAVIRAKVAAAGDYTTCVWPNKCS